MGTVINDKLEEIGSIFRLASIWKVCSVFFFCSICLRTGMLAILSFSIAVEFIDSKGGVSIGNSVGIAEDVRIFTLSHSEASHIIREYKPVIY